MLQQSQAPDPAPALPAGQCCMKDLFATAALNEAQQRRQQAVQQRQEQQQLVQQQRQHEPAECAVMSVWQLHTASL